MYDKGEKYGRYNETDTKKISYTDSIEELCKKIVQTLI